MEFDWLDILEKVFEILVFPALSAAALYFITWIKAKKTELKQKTKAEVTKKYLDMLDVTITDCVLATNQTYVDTLKKEGTFDVEAQKKAFQLTYNTVMNLLTDEAQKYIGETVNDLGAYVTNKIEAQINMVKK